MGTASDRSASAARWPVTITASAEQAVAVRVDAAKSYRIGAPTVAGRPQLDGTPFDGHSRGFQHMGLPIRLRIIVPGSATILVLGLLGAWMSLSSFFVNPGFGSAVRYAISVVLAPLFLLVPGVRSWAGETMSISAESSAIAVVAIVALPWHPIFPSRWAAVLTILGLVGWLLCEIVLVTAPA